MKFSRFLREGAGMSLVFAVNWNKDFKSEDKYAKIIINGRIFGFSEARGVLRAALAHPMHGQSLKDSIDKHKCRLINGPHHSDPTGDAEVDKKYHMTLHNTVSLSIYHIKVSELGMYETLSRESQAGMNPKTGNPKDDWDSPNIPNSASL